MQTPTRSPRWLPRPLPGAGQVSGTKCGGPGSSCLRVTADNVGVEFLFCAGSPVHAMSTCPGIVAPHFTHLLVQRPRSKDKDTKKTGRGGRGKPTGQIAVAAFDRCGVLIADAAL